MNHVTKVRNINLENIDSAQFKDFIREALDDSEITTVIHSAYGNVMIGPDWFLNFAENEGMTGVIEEVL